LSVFTDGDGNQFCVPQDKCRSNQGNIANPEGVSDPTCKQFPITLKKAIDPNDKVGTQGVSDPGFVQNAVPLNYAVHFENLATATGAAQVVIVTDQLDTTKLDLTTFQLGPMTVGNNVAFVPNAGLQSFVSGLEFRPERDLILTVDVALDLSTGLVTWRFTTIDPSSGEITDDPDAGFLPPNTAPPAGEGSVMFGLMPKSGLV